jgi:hypothetical protein
MMLSELQKSIAELATAISHFALAAQEHDNDVIYHWMRWAGVIVGFIGATFYAYYWGMKAFREKIHQLLIDPDNFWSKSAPNLEMFSNLGNYILEQMGLKEKTQTNGELVDRI